MKAAADPDGIRKLATRVRGAADSRTAPAGDVPSADLFGHPALAGAAGRFHVGSADAATGLTGTTESTGDRLGETADLYDAADRTASDAADETADQVEDDA